MKIIMFAVYRLVDLQPDGFLIFSAGSFRTVGRSHLAAQWFWTEGWTGLGTRQREEPL